MKRKLLGFVVAILFVAAISPVPNAHANVFSDFSNWIQTSFFGPQQFGGSGFETDKIDVTSDSSDSTERRILPPPTTTETVIPPSSIPVPGTTTTQSTPPITVPTAVSCFDSDGGKNAQKQGSVRWRAGGKLKNFTDKNSGNGIVEFSCENNSVRGNFIPCEYGTTNGACKSAPDCPEISCAAPQPGCTYISGTFDNGCTNPCAETVCDDEIPNSCFDSDQGSFVEKGTVTGIINGVSETHTDLCFTELGGPESQEGSFLGEWFCSSETSIGYTGAYCDCVDGACGSDIQTSTNDLTPRISFWYGKVNQHVEGRRWKTDPDGVSGGGTQAQWGDEGWADRPVEYCQKFWPDTISVEEYQNETITSWRTRGNTEQPYTATKPSYKCVRGGTATDPEINVTYVPLSNTNVVAGTTDISFFKFVVDNSEDVEVRVQGLSFNAQGTGNAVTFSNFWGAVFADGIQQGDERNLDFNGFVNFNFSHDVPAGEQQEFTIILNTLESSAPGTFSLNLIDVFAAAGINPAVIVTVLNGESPVSLENPLVGETITLTQGGVLSVDLDSVVPSDVIIAGQSNVDVMKIRFNAADDEIQVKDIYLENDLNNDESPDNNEIGDRLDFKLYNEAGQLIQGKYMVGGKIHFELANADRIRVPNNDSTFVTIKVDARDITQSSQTGKRLQLSLDGNHATGGLEAVTASTGGDLTTPANGWESTPGAVTGKDFVVYKTEASIQHAFTQPMMNLPSAASTEFYRFTVMSDSADETEIGKATLDLSLNGLSFSGQAEFTTMPIVNGAPDPTQQIPTSFSQTNNGSTSAEIRVNFSNERLSPNESRTYAVFVSATQEVGTVQVSDGVTVSFFQDPNYTPPTTKDFQQGASIIWSDESSPMHSADTSDWLNGYLVDIEHTAINITK